MFPALFLDGLNVVTFYTIVKFYTVATFLYYFFAN